VGGTITGLTGTGLVLKDTVNNNQVTVTAGSASFTITPGVAPGGTYNVSVLTQPSTPAQFCRVTGATGNITTANITSVAVACTNVGQVVFVANPYDNGNKGTLASFTITPSTGALTPANGNPNAPAVVPAATDNNPTGIAVDPSGNFLYVANSGTYSVGTGNDVATWTIDPAGTLTVEGTPVTISPTNQPGSLAIDPVPSGSPYLYVGANDSPNGTLDAFNPVLGVLGAPLTVTPYTAGNVPNTLVVDSTRQFVFEPNNFDGTIGVFAISTGGVLAAITGSPFALLGAPYAVAASPTGQFIYVTDTSTSPGTVNEFSYDNTGALTLVNTYTVGVTPYGVAIDPSGQFLYVSNAGDGTVSGFTITTTGPNTGALTSVGPAVTTGGGVSATQTSLVVDPSSQYLYVANGDNASTGSSISVFTITPVTGVPVAVGSPVPATNGGGNGTTAIAIK